MHYALFTQYLSYKLGRGARKLSAQPRDIGEPAKDGQVVAVGPQRVQCLMHVDPAWRSGIYPHPEFDNGGPAAISILPILLSNSSLTAS